MARVCRDLEHFNPHSPYDKRGKKSGGLDWWVMNGGTLWHVGHMACLSKIKQWSHGFVLEEKRPISTVINHTSNAHCFFFPCSFRVVATGRFTQSWVMARLKSPYLLLLSAGGGLLSAIACVSLCWCVRKNFFSPRLSVKWKHGSDDSACRLF